VCLVAIYHKLASDDSDGAQMKGAWRLMQRELGYLTKHQCTRGGGGYKCSTGDSEGWSYMVGCARGARLRMNIFRAWFSAAHRLAPVLMALR
jgi:hypothetical protein